MCVRYNWERSRSQQAKTQVACDTAKLHYSCAATMAALRRAAAQLKALPATARAIYDAPRSVRVVLRRLLDRLCLSQLLFSVTQVSSAVCLRNAEMEDILVDETPKQGWGGTLIHDVLLAKVRRQPGNSCCIVCPKRK